MNKIVYIIPGFKEYPENKIYLDIAKTFAAAGFIPKLIHIHWKSKNKLMGDYLMEFMKEFNKANNPNSKIYLFGFSAGAWIAFMASLDIVPEKAFICSLSPYFNEDMKDWKQGWIKEIGRNRFNDFRNYRFNKLIKDFKSKAVLFVGANEAKVTIKRALTVHKGIKNSKLVIIPEAEHDIRNPNYLKSIKNQIS